MRVSMLGLGRMETEIAERLLGAGHELAVWNRTTATSDPFVERAR